MGIDWFSFREGLPFHATNNYEVAFIGGIIISLIILIANTLINYMWENRDKTILGDSESKYSTHQRRVKRNEK